MSRFLRTVIVAVAVMTVIVAPASAAPDEDFATGSGVIVVLAPGFPPIVVDIFVDAHSDASGGNPGGTVNLSGNLGGMFTGPVTCLVVTGNRATIGFEDASAGHITIVGVDKSATGSPDTFVGSTGTTGCSPVVSEPFSLVSGDFVVHDAVPLTSKSQCRDGGWRDFTDDEGHPFMNQGECIAFVQHAA